MIDIDELRTLCTTNFVGKPLQDEEWVEYLECGKFRDLLDELTALRAAQQWRGIHENTPRKGPIMLLLGETIPDVPDWRVGTYLSGDESEELGYREYAKYGAWMIWSSADDWYCVDISEPIGWAYPPQPLPPGNAQCEHQSQPGPCSVCGDMG